MTICLFLVLSSNLNFSSSFPRLYWCFPTRWHDVSPVAISSKPHLPFSTNSIQLPFSTSLFLLVIILYYNTLTHWKPPWFFLLCQTPYQDTSWWCFSKALLYLFQFLHSYYPHPTLKSVTAVGVQITQSLHLLPFKSILENTIRQNFIKSLLWSCLFPI